MLPSLGFNEILILAVLALLVVGPKDLPLLFRKLGKWTAKLRGMAPEFRTGFDELARQAELDELKREVDALRRTASLQEVARDLTRPLPTLEDYAGVSPPPPPLPAPDASTSPLVGEVASECEPGGGRSSPQAPERSNAPHAPAPTTERGGGDTTLEFPEHAAPPGPAVRSAP